MKRTGLLLAFAGAIVAAFMFGTEPSVADQPKGSSYFTTVPFTITVDSTKAKQRDTVLTISDMLGVPAGNTGKVCRFDDVQHYGTVVSRVLINYTAVDTGTTGTKVDTTKDTIIVIIKTSDESMSAFKEIRRDTLTVFHVAAAVVNTDYIWRDLSDSILGANIYYEFVVALQDSVYTKARLGAGLDYKATVNIWAK